MFQLLERVARRTALSTLRCRAIPGKVLLPATVSKLRFRRRCLWRPASATLIINNHYQVRRTSRSALELCSWLHFAYRAISCSACSFFIVCARRYLVDGPKSRARCMLRVRRTCWSVRHCIHRRRARLECVLHRQGQRQWTTPLYGGVRAAIPEDGGDAPGEGGHGCSACGARPPAATTPRQSGRLARPCKVPCTDSVRDPCAAPRRTRSPARCVCSSLVANTVTMGWVGVPTGICPAIQYVHLAQGKHLSLRTPLDQSH